MCDLQMHLISPAEVELQGVYLGFMSGLTYQYNTIPRKN